MEFSEILFNGKIINSSNPYQISVFSPSFQYGLNVFEGFRGYLKNDSSINIFALEEHVERLLSSAEMIGFEINFDKEIIIENLKKLLKLNKFEEDIYIKYILCISGEGSWYSVKKIDRIAFFYSLPSKVRKGISNLKSAKFTSITRISNNSLPPKIKCGANYINSRLGYLEVNSNDNDNYLPIFLNNLGQVTESSGSCIFMIKGNLIKTPPLESSILDSITRRNILQIIESDNDLLLEISVLDRWDLLSADSVFFVGTNVEILELESIGKHFYKMNNYFLNKIINNFREMILKC